MKKVFIGWLVVSAVVGIVYCGSWIVNNTTIEENTNKPTIEEYYETKQENIINAAKAKWNNFIDFWTQGW